MSDIGLLLAKNRKKHESSWLDRHPNDHHHNTHTQATIGRASDTTTCTPTTPLVPFPFPPRSRSRGYMFFNISHRFFFLLLLSLSDPPSICSLTHPRPRAQQPQTDIFYTHNVGDNSCSYMQIVPFRIENIAIRGRGIHCARSLPYA